MKNYRLMVSILLVMLLGLPSLTLADTVNENAVEPGKGTSGLVLPRFASLRSGDVNMRTGPGTRYPIEWTYKHKGLPVEITAEYEVWRRVKDPDGSIGWVHKSALTGKRAAIITGANRDMREEADSQAAVVAHIEVGVIGELLACNATWCKLRFDGTKGFLLKSEFWGAYPNETFN